MLWSRISTLFIIFCLLLFLFFCFSSVLMEMKSAFVVLCPMFFALCCLLFVVCHSSFFVYVFPFFTELSFVSVVLARSRCIQNRRSSCRRNCGILWNSEPCSPLFVQRLVRTKAIKNNKRSYKSWVEKLSISKETCIIHNFSNLPSILPVMRRRCLFVLVFPFPFRFPFSFHSHSFSIFIFLFWCSLCSPLVSFSFSVSSFLSSLSFSFSQFFSYLFSLSILFLADCISLLSLFSL